MQTLKSLLLACLLVAATAAEDLTPKVAEDGTVTTVSAQFPFSSWASPQALTRFREILREDKGAPGIADPLASRKFYDKINSDRAERMKKLYPVQVEATTIAGVPVAIVSTAVSNSDPRRVLINLHGGAFLWGAGSGGLVESIPIASLSKIAVVTVDYRQGPENTYPAATEDVEKVYRALLRRYPASGIGIYGCSAGGVLSAQSVAWFQRQGLPRPGAVGIFCAGVVNMDGDSYFVGPMLMGQIPPAPHPPGLGFLSYFQGADFGSPLVLPGNSAEVLAKFPPTLLISGTRDMALSAVLRSDDLLTRAGAVAELHVWEGMWHSFFSDPELPESKAAYAVIAEFFDRRLAAHRPVAQGTKTVNK
ncbi:MAG: alpha/beta hydrolase [Steroidobacteraceae bacterium]